MAVTNIDEALAMLLEKKSGAVWFTNYDESNGFASGALDDISYEYDDPDEIGYFTIRDSTIGLVDIPFNGFQELVECPVGTPVQ